MHRRQMSIVDTLHCALQRVRVTRFPVPNVIERHEAPILTQVWTRNRCCSLRNGAIVCNAAVRRCRRTSGSEEGLSDPAAGLRWLARGRAELRLLILGEGPERRIRLGVSTQNRGLPTTRNLALDLASGRSLADPDSDDVMHPQRLVRQIAFLMQVPAASSGRRRAGVGSGR